MRIVVLHIDLDHGAEYDLRAMEVLKVLEHPTTVGKATLICSKPDL